MSYDVSPRTPRYAAVPGARYAVSPAGGSVSPAAARYAVSPGVEFVPTQLTGLKLWLRGSLTDSSGQGNNLTAVGGSLAAAESARLGARLGIVTSAAYAARATFTGGAVAQAYELFFVGTGPATDGVAAWFDGGTGTARALAFNDVTVTRNVSLYAGANILSASGATIRSQRFILNWRVNGASSAADLHRQGVTTSWGGNDGAQSLNGFTVGADQTGANRMTTDFGEAIVFSRVLTAAERAQVIAYVRSYYDIDTRLINVAYVGDSVTAGAGLAGGQDFPSLIQALLYSGWSKTNLGHSAYSVAYPNATGTLQAVYAAEVAAIFDNAKRNVLVLETWGNDIYYGATAAQQEDAVKQYALTAIAAGWRVILVGAGDRRDMTAGQLTTLAAYNALIRANYAQYAHRFVDVAADARFQNATDVTYYQGDQVHPNATGAGVLRDLIKAQVDTI